MMGARFRIGDLVSSLGALRGFGIYMGATSGAGGLLHEFVWFYGVGRPVSLVLYGSGVKAYRMRRA